MISPSDSSDRSSRLRYPESSSSRDRRTAHVAAVGTDLPEHPRFAERPVTGEEVVVEGADPLGDEPG